jgi:hypothetical protein
MSQLAATSGAEQADARHRLGVRRATLLAASLAFFVILLDTSIVNLALARMQDALGTNLAGLKGSSWHIGAARMPYGAPEEVRTPFTRFVVRDHSSGPNADLEARPAFWRRE